MHRLLLLAVAAPLILAGGPARADQPLDQWFEDFTVEGLDDLQRDFERFIENLPRFEAPYVDDNGNIVIPRQRQGESPPGQPPATHDGFEGEWT
jgi:hypothetical protein